jgi:hypothetical protein
MNASSVGSFRLAEQIGAWGVFAEIALSVVDRTAPSPFVTFDPGIQVDPWGHECAAIGFGAVYAIEFLNRAESDGIVVHKLHTNPVDTTPMALAFATCHAMFNCFSVSPESGPYFDRSTRSFVFPGRTRRST